MPLGPIPITLQDYPYGTPSFGRMDSEYGYQGIVKKKIIWTRHY